MYKCYTCDGEITKEEGNIISDILNNLSKNNELDRFIWNRVNVTTGFFKPDGHFENGNSIMCVDCINKGIKAYNRKFKKRIKLINMELIRESLRFLPVI
jgi:hypothetical protein